MTAAPAEVSGEAPSGGRLGPPPGRGVEASSASSPEASAAARLLAWLWLGQWLLLAATALNANSAGGGMAAPLAGPGGRRSTSMPAGPLPLPGAGAPPGAPAR
jgi:hypothetical protein